MKRIRAVVALTLLLVLPATAGLSMRAGAAELSARDTARASPSSPSGDAIISFRAAVEAPAFQASEDEPTAATHPEGEGELVHTMATLDSTAGYALAAPVWPGAEAANAGGLLVLLGAPSQLGGVSDPVQAQARTGTGPPASSLTVGGATMEATATNEKVTADTTMVGTGPGPFTFSAAMSHSLLTYDGTAVTGMASSSAQDVNVGGVVTIQSLTSRADGTTDGAAPPKAKGSTVFAGLRVGGVPVAVDDTGFHVGSGPGSNPLPMQQVNQALSGAGMELFYVAPHDVTVGRRAFYYAASLLVFWAPPHDSSDNTFTLSLGGAAVDLSASRGVVGGILGGTPLNEVGAGAPLPPATVVSSLPANAGVPSSVASRLPAFSNPSPPKAEAATVPARLVRRTFPVSGVGGGWILLLILGSLAGAVAFPRVPALLRAAATPECAHARRRPTGRS